MRGSRVFVGDNTEVRIARCIGVLKRSGKRPRLGSLIVVAIPFRRIIRRLVNENIKLAVIVTVGKEKRRLTGFYVRALYTKVLLLKNETELIGNRIYGPIAVEVHYSHRIKAFAYARLTI